MKRIVLIIIRAETYSRGSRRVEDLRGEDRCGEAQRYAPPDLMRGVTTSVTPPRIWRDARHMPGIRKGGDIYAN